MEKRGSEKLLDDDVLLGLLILHGLSDLWVTLDSPDLLEDLDFSLEESFMALFLNLQCHQLLILLIVTHVHGTGAALPQLAMHYESVLDNLSCWFHCFVILLIL